MSTHDPLTTMPTSDPAVVLRFRDRQYAADLIGAALLEFDLFTYLDKHPNQTLQQLCEHFGWLPRPADVLMTLCRASGFVQTDDAGQNRLTPVGQEYLVEGSPWCLKPYYKPIADSPVLKDYVQILKSGKPANWQAKADGADWHESMKDEKFAMDFTNLMNCRGIAFGQHLAAAVSSLLDERQHLLDVGGGSGIYSSTLVAQHPHLRATVLEQPPVDGIAEQEIERCRLGQQISVVSGDMFQDPWPHDVDTILLSNLLHDWDVPEATHILQRCQTLPPNGLLIVHGAIINEEKTGPLPVAEYSSLLMNITQGKCYSVTEYKQMTRALGFRWGPYQPTVGDRGLLTAVLSS